MIEVLLAKGTLDKKVVFSAPAFSSHDHTIKMFQTLKKERVHVFGLCPSLITLLSGKWAIMETCISITITPSAISPVAMVICKSFKSFTFFDTFGSYSYASPLEKKGE